MTDTSDSPKHEHDPELFTPEVFDGVGVVHIETEAFTADAIQLFELDQDQYYEFHMADQDEKPVMLREMFESALVDPKMIEPMSVLSMMNMNEVLMEWQMLSSDLMSKTLHQRLAERKAAKQAGLEVEPTTSFGLLE